jgi:subtilase family serine protease
MRRISLIMLFVLIMGATAVIFTRWASAQSSNAERRITLAIDETKMVQLKGNTHPFARPEFDQGAAPADLPLERMMLVLQRSPEREAALEKLMAEQMDKSSPNYHRWITPVRFGEEFGPSDEDIQTITSWLESHGFQINSVAKGRNIIDFSGNAGQVKEALHTEIHKYNVRGKEHWANSGDPQIPAALTPVVLGVNRLHNFFPKAMNRNLGVYSSSRTTGQIRPVKPQFTYNQGAGNFCGVGSSTNCFVVGPADFAAIYHVQQLWDAGIDGTGQTIAIVNDSNINIADATNFRSLFGLPANNPTVILAGTDPGPTDDEIEADIDTQWAGAVAKGATIKLVIAANTNTQSGVDIAAQFIVDNNVAPVVAESFGNCESILGSAENSFINGLWQMAVVANGQTVLTSSGDQGSTDCENPNPNLTTPQPAKTGLAVSGLSTTPFDTAVGGTDFNQFNNQTAFWNTTPSTSATGQTQLTAKSYVPENVWNDSCTNEVFIEAGFDPNVLTACNDARVSPSFIVPVGSGGGASSIYPKPTWQTGTGVPNDGQRDVPDLSLFAGAGLVGSFYVACQQDADPGDASCNLNSPFQDFQGVGGTSVSTQAFAGIMAMVLQHNSPTKGLGLINPTLYSLAANLPAANCNSSNPGASCIFNDITIGTNSQPCVLGTSGSCGQAITAQVTAPPNTVGFGATRSVAILSCIFAITVLLLYMQARRRSWTTVFALIAFASLLTIAACGSGGGNSVGNGGGGGGGGQNPNGVLSGFNAGVGYDQATGLGSVNAFNLVENW